MNYDRLLLISGSVSRMEDVSNINKLQIKDTVNVRQ